MKYAPLFLFAVLSGCAAHTGYSNKLDYQTAVTVAFTPAVLESAVAPRAMTITGIQVGLSAAEGAAATLAFSFASCTPSAGACTPTASLVTCTVPNNGYTCSANGFTVAVAAGDRMWWQMVQVGTGTTAIGNVSFTYN